MEDKACDVGDKAFTRFMDTLYDVEWCGNLGCGDIFVIIKNIFQWTVECRAFA